MGTYCRHVVDAGLPVRLAMSWVSTSGRRPGAPPGDASVFTVRYKKWADAVTYTITVL